MPRGCIGYIIGLLILIGTIAGFAFILISGIMGMLKGSQQVLVPGSAQITIAKPGDYQIAHEYHSVYKNTVMNTPEEIPNLTVSLKRDDTGAEVPLKPASGGTYSMGGREGVGLFDFTAPIAGSYTIEAHYADGSSEPQTVLSVNEGMTRKILAIVFGSISLMFGGLCSGPAIMLATFLLTRKRTSPKGAVA